MQRRSTCSDVAVYSCLYSGHVTGTVLCGISTRQSHQHFWGPLLVPSGFQGCAERALVESYWFLKGCASGVFAEPLFLVFQSFINLQKPGADVYELGQVTVTSSLGALHPRSHKMLVCVQPARFHSLTSICHRSQLAALALDVVRSGAPSLILIHLPYAAITLATDMRVLAPIPFRGRTMPRMHVPFVHIAINCVKRSQSCFQQMPQVSWAYAGASAQPPCHRQCAESWPANDPWGVCDCL